MALESDFIFLSTYFFREENSVPSRLCRGLSPQKLGQWMGLRPWFSRSRASEKSGNSRGRLCWNSGPGPTLFPPPSHFKTKTEKQNPVLTYGPGFTKRGKCTACGTSAFRSKRQEICVPVPVHAGVSALRMPFQASSPQEAGKPPSTVHWRTEKRRTNVHDRWPLSL